MRKAFLLFMALVCTVSAQNAKLDIRVEFLPDTVYEYGPLFVKLDIRNNTADTIQLVQLMNTLQNYGVLKGAKGEYKGTINVEENDVDLPPNGELEFVDNLDLHGTEQPFGIAHGYFRPDEYEATFKFKYRSKLEDTPVQVDEIHCKVTVLELKDINVERMIFDIAEMHKAGNYEQRCIKADSLIDVYKTSPIIRKLYALAIYYGSECIEDRVRKYGRIKEYIRGHPEDGLSYKMLINAHAIANKAGRLSMKREIDGGEMQVDMYEIYSECTDAKLKKYIEKKFIHKKKAVK